MIKNAAIIIPVYNEEAAIRKVVLEVRKHFANVVCVTDGSKDNSAVEIAKTDAFLIQHPINMGQGAALQTGMEFARQLRGVKYFVHFDADGQHQVKDAISMVKELEKGQYDILLGSRFLGKSIGMKWTKKALLKVATSFSNAITGMKLTDTHNGLRAFNLHVAETLQITQPDMSHASEILDLIIQNNYRYKEYPVTIVYSEYSMSKGQSSMNAINIGFDSVLRKISK